ncbi:MAG: HAD family hydrolase [Planctomycetaceae bacterium]
MQNPEGIVFDLGNTLVPWGAAEAQALYRDLRRVFEARLGPMGDFALRALAARDAFIAEREERSMREVTVEEFTARICGREAPAGLADEVGAEMHRSFVANCRVPAALPALLEELARRRPLAVLSNFCLTRPVEEVLERAGIARYFVHIEVSATGGLMKPHPAPFETVIEKLGTNRERTLMVGDNFWADVVGGYRAGLLTALTHEHVQGPTSDARAPGVKADRLLSNLHALADRS